MNMYSQPEYDDRIPVTILTGFLDAGKTTLLNRLIENNPDTKFAVIENEFGETSIDSELIIGADDGIFDLSNGCVCCSLNDELQETLVRLFESNFEFDHLIIESTGVADPNGIAASFLSEFCQIHFRLDGTICLADAKYIPEIIDQMPISHKQLTFADLILINKIDLINNDELANTKAKIASINAFAKIVDAINGDYGDIDILNLRAYETRGVEESLANDNIMQLGSFGDLTKPHDEIESLTFEFDVDFAQEYFRYGMNVLLETPSLEIYRIKGIIAFESEPNKVIFQSVMKSGIAALGEEWRYNERRSSRLVIIGKKLDRQLINDILLNCLVKDEG
jgi:G3E family GTPase